MKCKVKKFTTVNIFREEGGRRYKVWTESEQSVDMCYSSESLLYRKLIKMRANFPRWKWLLLLWLTNFYAFQVALNCLETKTNGGRSTKRDERGAGHPQHHPRPTRPTRPISIILHNTELIVFAPSGTAHGFTLSRSRCLLKNCYSTTQHHNASAMAGLSKNTEDGKL